MFSRLDSSVDEDILSIFAILAVAVRPLTEIELGTILGICRSDRSITSSWDIEPFRALGDILQKSVPTPATLREDNTMTFLHLSLNGYLYSSHGKISPNAIIKAHRQITRASLKYLRLEDMHTDAVEGASFEGKKHPTKLPPLLLVEYKYLCYSLALTTKYPLLPYARDFYERHLTALPPDDSLWLMYAGMATSPSVFTIPALYKGRYGGRKLSHSPLDTVVSMIDFPNQETLVRDFVLNGYDINEAWLRNDIQALHLCSRRLRLLGAKSNWERTGSLLVRLGANPNVGLTMCNIIYADAWNLYEECIQSPKIDINNQDELGRAVIHHLAHLGLPERISSLVRRRPSVDINIQDIKGHTPLHVAVLGSQIEVLRVLLGIPGIRLDLADKEGRTPLALTSHRGLKAVAHTLIDHSAALPLPKDGHISALVVAAINGQRDLCYKMLDAWGYKDLPLHLDQSGKGILHHAAANNWTDLLYNCLCFGDARVDQVDNSGASALHIAAALGNASSCRTLLDHGASLRLQNRAGRTAPQVAADAGFRDTLMVLLESGRADASQRDFDGRSLVHWAATLDCTDVMQLVINMPGTDLFRRDRHGMQPIGIAHICKCANVGRLLSREMKRRSPSGVASYDVYSWDRMYTSPLIEDVGRNIASAEADQWEDSLLVREVRRNKNSNDEWQQAHRLYPPSLWAMTVVTPPNTDASSDPPGVNDFYKDDRKGKRQGTMSLEVLTLPQEDRCSSSIYATMRKKIRRVGFTRKTHSRKTSISGF